MATFGSPAPAATPPVGPATMSLESKPSQVMASGQLDFYEAMADFRTMFPNMDPEVIETVLRANSGSVDATIDNLLKMSENCADFVPYRDVAREIVSKAEHSDVLQLELHSDLPPSYEQAVLEADEAEVDLDLEDLPPAPSLPQQHRIRSGPLPPLDLTRFHTSEPTSQIHTHPKRPLLDRKVSNYKNWNPPLLGTLPDDFLRLMPPTKRRTGGNANSSLISHPHTCSGHCADQGVSSHQRCRNCGRRHGGERQSGAVSSIDEPQGAEPVRQCRHHHHHHHHHHREHREREHREHRRRGSGDQQLTEERLEMVSGHDVPSLLQWRLAANRRARGSLDATVDPLTAQSLCDERLAIMLQNQEFLRWLRHDRDFMHVLNSEEQEMEQPEKLERLERRRHRHVQPSVQSVQHVVHQEPLEEIPVEGYGMDRVENPEYFSTVSVEDTEEDEELRRKLKTMGKNSRKKFMDLAKRFFSVKYKKKASGNPAAMIPFYKSELSTESTMNLLEDEEDICEEQPPIREEDEDEEELAGAVASSVPRYKTVQRPLYHPDCITTYHGDTDMV